MKKPFFECNLPVEAPLYLHYEIFDEFKRVCDRIRERHKKLQEALELSGMKPETFQVLTSTLFKQLEQASGNADAFDAKTPQQLSDYAKLMFVCDEPYERLDFPNADVLFDTAYATVKEWESMRHLGIGGSDSAVVEGTSKFRTKLDLYHDKCGTPLVIDINADKRSVFERGHIMEDSVIDRYCAVSGASRIRDTRMFRSKRYPHNIADIDAILRMPNDEIWLFEAKTTVAANYDAWKDNKVPPYYETQTHHYLAVLDDEKVCGTHIGCLFTYDLSICGMYAGSQYDASRFVSRNIERNLSLEEELLKRNEEFWNNYVDPGIPPDGSGDDKEKDLIKALTGNADPSLPVLNMTTENNVRDINYYMELCKQEDELKKQIEMLKDEKLGVQTTLIEQLGQAVEGRVDLPDGYYEVRYPPVRKIKTDLEKMEALYPDAFADCVSVDKESSRRFSVKKRITK